MTIERLIKLACEPKTHIHHDGFSTYTAVDWKGLKMHHTRHVHKSKYFINEIRRTMEHSNEVEGIWSVLKHYSITIYSTRTGEKDAIEGYLFEMLWRRDLRRQELYYRNRYICDTYKAMLP